MKALTFVLLGKDSLTPVVNKAGANVQKSSNQMSKALGQAAVAFGALTLAGAGISVKLAVDFQTSMEKIAGLVGVSQKQVSDWSNQILNLAGTLPQAPKELADALYFITSSGISGSKAMNVLNASARAAAAGLGQTEAVADAVTSVLNAYAGTGLTATNVTDDLVTAVKDGKAEADQFAKEIGRVIPIASQMGVSFDQAAAAMAALTLQGLDAEQSATGVRQVLTELIHPSLQASKMVEAAGDSFAHIRQELQQKGLLATLNILQKEFGANKEQIGKLFPDVRGLNAFLALTGKNTANTAKVFKDLANSTGSTDKAFQVASQTVQFKFKTALSGVQASAIRLGVTLLPIIAKALDLFNKLLGPISQNKIAFASMTLGVLAFAAVFKGLVTAVVLGSISMKAALITTGIGAVILALGVGIAELAMHWNTVWTAMKNVTLTVAHAITGAASDVWTWFKSHWPMLAVIIAGPIGLAAGLIYKYWGTITGAFQNGYNFVIGIFQKITSWVSSNFDPWWAANGQALKDIWNALWTAVTAVVKVALDAIIFVAKGFWNVMTTTFNIGKTIILGIWGALWPVLKAVFVAVWNLIQYAVQAGWVVLKTAFQVGAALVQLVWKNAWVLIHLIAVNTWAAVRTMIKIGWDLIVGIFSTFINLLTGRWGAAWNSIRNMFVQIWNAMRSFLNGALRNIYNATVAMWNNLFRFFGTVGSRILHAIGNLAGLLVGVGHQVVGGLFHGIVSALSNIGSWVKNNIFNPIIGAVKSLFGIHSPSTVMASIGGHLIGGLIKGLITSFPKAIIGKIFGGLPQALGAIVSKGLVAIEHLPAAALHALGSVGGAIGGFFAKLFGGGGSGVGQWMGVVLQALALNHLPASLAGQVLRQISTESGGNANAINLNDINAQMGDPSRGLLQTTGRTFAAYHVAGTSMNIYDPLANVAAAIHYAKNVYGPTLMSGGNGLGSGHGYALGGRTLPGIALVGEHGPELVSFSGGQTVTPNGKVNRTLSGSGGGDNHYHINVSVPPSANPAETGRQIVQQIVKFERVGGKGWRS